MAGLDHRFGWMTGPGCIYWASLLLGAAGHFITVYAMAENRFFATTVRIQEERGHRVVNSGPYSVVRHPGNAGAILFNIALPGLLGSSVAFLPAIATIAITMLRTWMEDEFLQRSLPGYTDYTKRIKWRLIPGVW